MNVAYTDYYGHKVSRRWNTVLRAADREGVKFHLDSGHRTMAEQLKLYRANMIRQGVPKPGHPMTAFPLPTAPHIRTGLSNHALDINALDGGANRFAEYLRRNGVNPRFTVAGEPWHLELSYNELRGVAKRLASKKPTPAPKPKPKPAAARKTSDTGVNLVTHFEGLRTKAYKDPVGIWTIGYGHTGKDVHSGQTITPTVAKKLLRNDLGVAEATALHYVKAPLSQGQFDALVSFIFNVGSGAFAGSTLLKKLNKRDYRGAADEFPKWNHGGGKVLAGLTARRNAERHLFLTGHGV